MPHILLSFPFLSECITLCMFGVAVLFLLVAEWRFGKVGIQLYACLAVVLANIQVLTATQMTFYSAPVPGGTVLFTTIFLANNLLTELYGPKSAQQMVGLGFYASLMVTALMMLTIATPSVDSTLVENMHYSVSHAAITTLFMPALSIFAASLIAYFASQTIDIACFYYLKCIWNSRYLWLRSALSNTVSGFLDNAIFSILAWWVFAAHPVSGAQLWNSYIIGAFGLRTCIMLLNIPALYCLRACAKTLSSPAP